MGAWIGPLSSASEASGLPVVTCNVYTDGTGGGASMSCEGSGFAPDESIDVLVGSDANIIGYGDATMELAVYATTDGSGGFEGQSECVVSDPSGCYSGIVPATGGDPAEWDIWAWGPAEGSLVTSEGEAYATAHSLAGGSIDGGLSTSVTANDEVDPGGVYPPYPSGGGGGGGLIQSALSSATTSLLTYLGYALASAIAVLTLAVGIHFLMKWVRRLVAAT